MNNHQAVVDQIVQNLAFEVEAVPKNNLMKASSISQSTPLNVKIKVRKKDEIHKQHDVSSIADDTPRAVQKVRLVNCDQIIMTFDVFMEAEFEKKPSRKLRKHIFDRLRPGICLGAVDDDKYPYMPSSSYSANITERSVANKSDGTLKQTFTLSKNVYQDYTVSTQPGGQKWLFGKCKPGGCLDPPFSEDKYSYKPSTRSESERGGEELLEEEDFGSDIYSKKIPITLNDEEVQSNGRHSSIFDSGLFKKKRKSSDKSTNTKLLEKTDSIIDIYQGESAKNSERKYSNSIITYPPKVRSDPRISDDKRVRSRGPSEDKLRKSFNDHPEPYFIHPKGVNRTKEKETLDLCDYPKHQSSDATDLRNSLKESFKMPVTLPVSIPVPIPIMSNKQKPEDIATNNNILKTQDHSANVTELDAIPDQKLQDQESQDAINLKDTDVPPELLRDTLATEDIDDKHVESSKVATLIPSNVEQPITLNQIDDQNWYQIKLEPLQEIDSENNIYDTAGPSKKIKTEPLKIPVPVPVPFIYSDINRAAQSKIINNNLQTSIIKLNQSNQSFETKKTPQTIKDTPLEDSKDMQQNIDPGNRSEKSELTATATPKSHYSDIEADAIPENYLRTRGGFSDEESDITIAPTMEEDTNRDSKGEKIIEGIKKPAKQNYIKDATVATTAVVAAAAAAATAATAAATTTIVESLETYEIPDTDTQQIKGSSKKDERKHSQRISLSKLPTLQNRISILSGSKTSAASVKYKTKRSDSRDKHLDNVEHRDTVKSISVLSGGNTSTTSIKDKTERSDSPDKHLHNVGHRDTDKSISILSVSKTSAASVIDKTKRSDSPDKHLDSVRYRDTDKSISILSGGKTSAAKVEDKTKKSVSPDNHLDNAKHRDTYESISILYWSKTSAASVKDKTKRSDSADKHLNNDGHRSTDKSISILSVSKTSAGSVKDKTKMIDGPDKYLDNIGHRDTDKSISILSGDKTTVASVKDKSKRSDSPDKHLDNVGHRDTDKSISVLSGGKTSAGSVKDKIKRSDSPDKHLDNVRHRDTDKSVSVLSGGKTSAGSVKDKTKRSDSPDKYLDNVGHRHTDKSISVLSGGKTSAESVKDKTKRSESPDKHLDNVRHRDTDKSISILSVSKTSAASVIDKTKRSDSRDKHLDNVGHRDTDKSISILSESKRSAASVIDKTKRSDNPDKHLDSVGYRDTDKSISVLNGGKTSAAKVEDKTKRSVSPDNHLDNAKHRDTYESISILCGSKTSAASVKDKTKRSDSVDKHLNNDGHRSTDKSISILSVSKTSAGSVKDKTKMIDSPDKYLDNIGHRDTDKSISVLSGDKTSVASVKDKSRRSDSPDKHLNNVGHRDTDKSISVLSGGKTSAGSVKDKTKRSDSPDKHLDNVGHRDTDKSISVLSGSKTSTSAVKDKTKRCDSPDKYLDNVRHRDTDKSISILSGGKTSAGSVKDKTKRSDSPDKYLDNVGHRDTDKSISVQSGGKTSAGSVKDKTKRIDSPDKYLDNIGHRYTDKSVSVLSGGKTSAGSVKDKTKRIDSPDKYLDNFGHRDTDKSISVLSGGKTSAGSVKDKTKRSDSLYKQLDTVRHRDTNDKIDSQTESQARFIHEGSMNFIASPVIINNTEPTPNFEPLKEVYSETNLFGEPINTGREFDPSGVPFTTQIVSRFRKFDEDDGTHSTVSRELNGTKSVIYDTDEYNPTTCAKISAERISSSDKHVILPVDTVMLSIQSTSTLKSAMKKDTISVELGFHSYLNDKNERILRTFNAENAPKRLPNDSVTVLKSQIRISSNEIRIPVDSEHDMSVQIKKANANQRVSISDSGFVNIIDNGRVKKQRSPVKCSDAEIRSSEAKAEVRKNSTIESVATEDHFIDYYEQELVPLQLIIKNLRDEIDVLAAQQLIFKDKLFCAHKSKLPRLVHSNKKCFGCARK